MSSGRVPLRTALDSPDSKRRYVRRLFATIADRYDLITVLLSFGLDATWKRWLVNEAEPLAAARALDLACGTGDIAFELARRGAHVTGLDITPRMIELARLRAARFGGAGSVRDGRRGGTGSVRDGRSAGEARFIVGDMMALPFPNGHFDVVTTGYGLRNVPELDGALREAARVLRHGGILVSLDFNRPANPLVRGVYLAYLTVVGSVLGYLLHRDPDTYRYIPKSLERYPGADAVSAMMRDAGFTPTGWTRVLGGLMAIHSATKP
jgi:demethylmenaquinone methyltransferase/2-methoxy-6-polyprenyl-1,4-benzoquinol methylase